ncbi:hypothetical protein DIPPA_32911 [Diplonema papillatum]|nr:hypothetical protein DIPPA_32911 [Diplonema papillatum]|eukprot:gene23096-35391_t
MSNTHYTEATTTTTIKKYPRPLWFKLTSLVMMIGIWFYFLLAVCIPYGKFHSKAEDPDSSIIMTAVGSGVVQGAAFFLGGLVMWGARRTFPVRVIGLVLLLLYCVGAVLLAIGRGRKAKLTFQYLDDHDYEGDDVTMDRTYVVGLLIGELGFVATGLLMLLPDFGILTPWE